MQDNNAYFEEILQKYQVKDLHRQWKKLQILKNLLIEWSGACYLNIYDYGARAKGTSTALREDVDYLLSISHICNHHNPSFKGCYSTLQEQLELHYPTEANNHSVVVKIDNLNVNITHAHASADNIDLHRFYIPQTKSWQKTNIHQHINDVLMSKRTREIKIIKIWRDLHQLKIPSIYLEYLIIQKLLSRKSSNPSKFADNVRHILHALAQDPASNPLFSTVVDPANKQNVLSDLISPEDKQRVIQQAKASIVANDIEQIVW